MSGRALGDWVGRSERIVDRITLAPALAAAAMLDDTATAFAEGAPLPPLWHWFYFLPRAAQARLGPDGHPHRGDFMPPIDLPRRMFAGARLRFHAPLIIGEPAVRASTIESVATKEGKSGALAFVTVRQVCRQGERVCIEEEQDIVYREAAAEVVPPPVVKEPVPPPADAWVETINPDPVLLFRFSALTFNAHRIHYDRDYAIGVERYPGLVVHGPLTALLLIELVRRRAGRPVATYAFRAEAPLFDLAPFRLVGLPRAQEVALRAEAPDGPVAMTATAGLG